MILKILKKIKFLELEKKKEGELILKHVKSTDHLVLLDEKGKILHLLNLQISYKHGC